MSDQQAGGLRVAVYDADYVLQGWMNDYQRAAVTFQYLDTGTGSIVLPEDHPMIPNLLDVGTRVVPVVVTWGGQRWSGRVAPLTLDEGDGETLASPGAGTVTVTLIDEWTWLKTMFAAPATRTGPLETVVKAFVSDAVTRIGGLPFAVVPAPVSDSSPTVTLTAAWTALDGLLTKTLRTNNYTVRLGVWLPGDAQPAGLSLTAPTVVFDLAVGADNPRIVWTDATILSRKIAVTAPMARTALLSSGSGEALVVTSYTDADLAGSLGAFGFPEAKFSATQDAPDPQADGLSQLRATAGGLGVQATVEDGAPWSAFVDYRVGDLVGIQALGLDIRERVTQIRLTDDRQNGLLVVPTIGDDAATLTPQQKLAKKVSALGSRVAQISTGA